MQQKLILFLCTVLVTLAGISHNGFRPNNNQSKQGVTA